MGTDRHAPTGPAFGRPDDKLCPRCPTSPLDRMVKVALTAWAKSRAVSVPCHQLRQAPLPTLRRFHTTGTRCKLYEREA